MSCNGGKKSQITIEIFGSNPTKLCEHPLDSTVLVVDCIQMVHPIVAVMPLQFNLFALQQLSQFVVDSSAITEQYTLGRNMSRECMDYIISRWLCPVDAHRTDVVASVSCYTNTVLLMG